MKSNIYGEKNSIARKLLVAVILMSSAMTILTSSYQLYNNYQRYVGEINVRFTEIQKIHLKNLSDRLWTADLQALKSNLQEIAVLPDIQYMEITEKNKIISSYGSKQDSNVLEKTFPMTHFHKDKEMSIGTLFVQATLNNADNQVLTQVLEILISNAIKTFFLAGFILFIFNYLVTRHLHSMAEFATQLDITKLDSQLNLDRKTTQTNNPDEIEILVQAFSSMQEKLSTSITQLKESELHFKQLVETTTAIPWEIDLSTNLFTYVGPQALNVLGYPITDWYTENFWRDHINSKDIEYVLKLRKKSIDARLDFELEYRMVSKDGRTIWIRDDVKVVLKDNKAIKLQGYMFDITKRKLDEIELNKHRNNLEKLISERTTELIASNKELESFAYSVSHDLRAPLRGIDGFSQILLEDFGHELDSTGLDYLTRIRTAAQMMGQIINDLLLLSRVTRQDIVLTEINLSTLASSVLTRLKENTGRNVQVIIEDNLITEADQNLITIVFENLFGNAWKYTNNNEKPIIEFSKTIKNNKTYFYIKDNGIGFNMQFVDKIFQPFQRLHSSSEFEGTGIGLANVSRVIHRHGGDIFAESTQGEGSTFYFNFSS